MTQMLKSNIQVNNIPKWSKQFYWEQQFKKTLYFLNDLFFGSKAGVVIKVGLELFSLSEISEFCISPKMLHMSGAEVMIIFVSKHWKLFPELWQWEHLLEPRDWPPLSLSQIPILLERYQENSKKSSQIRKLHPLHNFKNSIQTSFFITYINI